MESAQGWGLCWSVMSWSQETREVGRSAENGCPGVWGSAGGLHRTVRAKKSTEPVAMWSGGDGGRVGGSSQHQTAWRQDQRMSHCETEVLGLTQRGEIQPSWLRQSVVLVNLLKFSGPYFLPSVQWDSPHLYPIPIKQNVLSLLIQAPYHALTEAA